jgi:hypothetical protein
MVSFLGGELVGVKFEIVAHLHHLVFAYPLFSFGGERLQDSSVFPQCIADVPHYGIGVAVQTVVIGVAALVGTEFFVGSAQNGLPAFDACFFIFHNLSY